MLFLSFTEPSPTLLDAITFNFNFVTFEGYKNRHISDNISLLIVLDLST